MLNLIGVIIAFFLVIILIRKKINFGISLIVGSLIIGIFSLQTIRLFDIPRAFIEAIFYNFREQPLESIFTSFNQKQIFFETIELALLMTLIFVLAKIMQETGSVNKLIDSLRSFFSKGGILGLIPAIYGLMPVPGGALFSAPMIDEEGRKFKINKDQKNFLNVWFRHIWFAIYPVSSAMILICSKEFSNINIYTLVYANIPVFITSIAIGYYYIRRFIKKTNPPKIKFEKNFYGLIYILPPIIPILFYLFLQYYNFPQIRSFIIGVIFSIILLYFLLRLDLKGFIKLIKKSITINLALAIFGIMIFREMFEISEASVLIADSIGSLTFPSLIIIILIPIILGMLTGYNLGSVALSYPLIEPFFYHSGLNIIGITSIIFISSLVGYLISPIHLCNVVSSEYMKTDTTRMYMMYLPSVALLIIIQSVFVILFFSS